MTEEQLHGAALAFAWAAQQFGIATDTLAGHRDVSGDTACPGANLYAHVSSGDLKRRVDDLLAAGTVDLQPFVDPRRPQSSRTSRQAAELGQPAIACSSAARS